MHHSRSTAALVKDGLRLTREDGKSQTVSLEDLRRMLHQLQFSRSVCWAWSRLMHQLPGLQGHATCWYVSVCTLAGLLDAPAAVLWVAGNKSELLLQLWEQQGVNNQQLHCVVQSDLWDPHLF